MSLTDLPAEPVSAQPEDPFQRMEFFRANTVGLQATPIAALPVQTALRSTPITMSSDVAKARRRLASPNERRRTASLLVLLGYLDGITFDEAADLLSTSSPQLLRWVRAQHTVPVLKFEQIELFATTLRHLHRVLEPRSTHQWLHTPIPDLGGHTPYQAIKRRRFQDVAALARSYTEPPVFT